MNGVARATLLVVDDEPQVRTLLRRCFESDGYRVLEAGDGASMLEALATDSIDLITLDINLGGQDGLELARQVRATSDVSIIMVSGKGELIDTVLGLELGADDYIAKPFELREVLARTKAVLRRSRPRAAGGVPATAAAAAPPVDRRSQIAPDRAVDEARDRTADEAAGGTGESIGASGGRYRFAGCTLDVPARECIAPDGQPMELTTSEFDLLRLFVTHPRQALTRDRIMDGLRGQDWNPTDRTIDNHVLRLRRKLDSNGAERAIRTVRGVGYQFALPVTRD